MPNQDTGIPDDLLGLSKQLEQWRSAHSPRTRLPESLWAAAAEMARRHGLHRTTKALRMDYMRLKKRTPREEQAAKVAPCSFLEWMGSASTAPAECVVEWESTRGRMRVAMKGVTPDWTSLLRAWRES